MEKIGCRERIWTKMGLERKESRITLFTEK